MSPHTTERIQGFVDKLIAEGNAVVASAFAGYDEEERCRDVESIAKWYAKCRQLGTLLGDVAPWTRELRDVTAYSSLDARNRVGMLCAVAELLKDGLLVRVEQLVRAEAFDDLLGQAEYLREEGYYVAAGVLARGVLENHLRAWCASAVCAPAKPRPTLADYTTALYLNKHVDKLTMKHIEAMAATGNDAAHAKSTPQAADVDRLVRDVRAFLVQHTGP